MSIEPAARRGAAGFTLLEVIIALTVFALIGTASYRLLDSLTLGRGAVAASADRRGQLGRSLLVIEQDLLHLLPRSVRQAGGSQRAAALSNRGQLLELSRGGLPLPRALWRDGVARVVYELDDSTGEATLCRVVYRALDRLEATGHYRQELLPGVAAVQFRFMAAAGGWSSQWPRAGADGVVAEAELNRLPAAVEVTVRLVDDREVVKLVSLR